jgi:ATP-dependent Lhr-like helicase
LLCALVVVPAEILAEAGARGWGIFVSRLDRTRRATVARAQGREYLVAAERAAWLRELWPEVEFSVEMWTSPGEVPDNSDVLLKSCQGWLQILGPATSAGLAARLGVDSGAIWQQMLRLEAAGTALRGVFEHPIEAKATGAPIEGKAEPLADGDVEWCERRILQRIHKRTLHALRKQIEPVTPAAYLRFLLDWQHLAERRQLTGEQGLLEALRGLEGFEAPAAEWERSLLPQRVAGYDPRWLDALCLTGAVGWGRISPHPAFAEGADDNGSRKPRRVVPTSMAPVTFFVREEALWMDLCLSRRQIPEATLTAALSETANRVRSCLAERGAMFTGDLIRALGAEDVHRALWELVAAGLATADGFDSLRALINPRRKRAFAAPGKARNGAGRNAAGRWALLAEAEEPLARGDMEAAGRAAARRDAQVESACRMLLRRYGVVFRDVLARETTAPPWRELVAMLRRLEARGVVRGGRFVQGFGGEQFALPEAADALRAGRNRTLAEMAPLTIAAADPMNLIGVVVPGERVAAIAGNTVTLAAAAAGAVPAEPGVVELPAPGALAWDGLNTAPADGHELEGGAIA